MESASEHRINDERLKQESKEIDAAFPAALNACISVGSRLPAELPPAVESA
jgi:hypothetical protein